MDNACLWWKKLNFHFLISLFSGIAFSGHTEKGCNFLCALCCRQLRPHTVISCPQMDKIAQIWMVFSCGFFARSHICNTWNRLRLDSLRSEVILMICCLLPSGNQTFSTIQPVVLVLTLKPRKVGTCPYPHNHQYFLQSAALTSASFLWPFCH